MKILKIFLPLFIVIILSCFAIKPFLLSGFFPIHDDTQVARVFEMTKSLKDGMFPVRWVSDLGYGYGYPIFNFYAPLAYYVGGIFNLGFDSLIATKIMMVLGIVLSGIFMYLFAKEFWGRMGGIIAALLYMYAPYHAVDIYVRGDVAEFWAYAFIPLVFLSIYKIFIHSISDIDLEKFKIKSTIWKWVCVSAVAYACIILSHNLTAMMITPFILITAFIFYSTARSRKNAYKPYFILVGLFIGLLLSSFYWLPVFAEMKYTNVLSQVGGGADYKDHFVCPIQLWDSPWGFGGSTATCIDGLSYKLGKLHILLGLFGLAGLIFFWKTSSASSGKVKFGIIALFSISLLFSLFLMLKFSQFIWDFIPQMAFFQYPWRFLLITSFFISFLGGGVVLLWRRLPRSISGLAMTGIICSIIFFNAELFVPQMYLNKTANDYTNKQALVWTTSKISDEYMPKDFVKPRNISEVPNKKVAFDNIEIISLKEKTQNIQAEVIAREKTDILINLAYFPSWHVFIDEQEVEFAYSNKGIIISILPGKHTIAISSIQTSIEKFANSLSLAGILILFLGIIVSQREEKKHAKKIT